MLSSSGGERTLYLPPALPQMVQKLGTPLALPPAHTLISLLGLAPRPPYPPTSQQSLGTVSLLRRFFSPLWPFLPGSQSCPGFNC